MANGSKIAMLSPTARVAINTHGHHIYVRAVVELMEWYHTPFYLHRADEQLLKHANLCRMPFQSRVAIRIPAVTQD